MWAVDVWAVIVPEFGVFRFKRDLFAHQVVLDGIADKFGIGFCAHDFLDPVLVERCCSAGFTSR